MMISLEDLIAIDLKISQWLFHSFTFQLVLSTD